MSKIIIGIILITIIAVVLTASLSYYVSNQPNQNNPSPTPTLTPTPTPTPIPTPSLSEEPTEPVVIPKPSVPEFTVKLVDNSYDVPDKTTTEIDQYTGKEVVTTIPGYHVENKSIEITIKNQPLSPYTDADGYEGKLYYNVRVKGHFGEEWTTPIPFQRHDPVSRIPVYSSSGYTVVTCSANYPTDSHLDFQVEAFTGYYYYEPDPYHVFGMTSGFKVDKTSGWSSTQTIFIP